MSRKIDPTVPLPEYPGRTADGGVIVVVPPGKARNPHVDAIVAGHGASRSAVRGAKGEYTIAKDYAGWTVAALRDLFAAEGRGELLCMRADQLRTYLADEGVIDGTDRRV